MYSVNIWKTSLLGLKIRYETHFIVESFADIFHVAKATHTVAFTLPAGNPEHPKRTLEGYHLHSAGLEHEQV